MVKDPRERAKYIFLTMVPFLLIFIIQIAAALDFSFVYNIVQLSKSASVQEYLSRVLNSQGSSVDMFAGASILYCVFSIPIFGVWYYILKKENGKTKTAKANITLMLAGIVVFVVGAQFLCNYIECSLAAGFPEWAKTYEDLIESSGLGDAKMSPLVFLYAILLGPVCEELAFRGVTLNLGLKGISFVAANLIQALFFGALHMNVIQSIYAFVFGLLLGYIYYLYGNIVVTIACHILFNGISGIVGYIISAQKEVNAFSFFMAFLASMLITYAGIIFLKKASPKEVKFIESQVDNNSEGTNQE